MVAITAGEGRVPRIDDNIGIGRRGGRDPEQLYTAKDRERGYAVDWKRVALAYGVEITIIVTSLIGAWQFTVMYGKGDSDTILMMMLAPIAFAMVEFCRVPLAIAVRKPSYRLLIKVIIVMGLIGAAFVTVKSVSQLAEIMFRPRLFDVTHAQETLVEAEAGVALINSKISDADALVTQRQTEAQSADQEVKTATENLAKIDGQKCSPISGIGKNGHRYQGMKCSVDPRVAALKETVTTATGHRAEVTALLNEATAARKSIDRTAAEEILRGEKTKYREAVLHSQLHSFASMIFFKKPIDVTDDEVAAFLFLFVFIPAIGAAFSATIIALTAIIRIPPSHVDLADDTDSYVLGPLVAGILKQATDDHIRSLHEQMSKNPPPADPATGTPHLKAV